jgi:NAD(P)-dependent dehydrogenase (short-subunit alcohol dehydrogenase family)
VTAPLAVVTGAAGALGSAVLDDLTGRGWTVAAFDRPGDRLDEAGRRDGVVPVPVDLLDRTSVRAAWEQVDGVGTPTALVALAGGFRASSLADLDEELLGAMWGTNVTALLWCCQAAAPRMAAAGGGAIVTVGSRSAVSGSAPVAYGASKAAVVRATEVLADELRPQRIRVNCVLPSVIDSPANRSWMSPALAAKAVPTSAIAAVIAFLVGPESAPVSGARIPVYGDA